MVQTSLREIEDADSPNDDLVRDAMSTVMPAWWNLFGRGLNMAETAHSPDGRREIFLGLVDSNSGNEVVIEWTEVAEGRLKYLLVPRYLSGPTALDKSC